MKKLIKIILAASVLFALGFSAFAEEASEEKNMNAVGVYAIGSSNAVYGIQYEHRFSDLISGKVNTYGLYRKWEGSRNPLYFNALGEIDFTLYEESWFKNSSSRLYAYLLAGYSGEINREADYDSETGTYTYSNQKYSSNAIVSVGFGFDFIFLKHLSIPVQFGFMGTFPNDQSLGFCGGAGLRYSW